MLLNLDPVLLRLGPVEVRVYGLMMALSVAIGIYFFLKNGRKKGFDEDFLLSLALWVVFGGIIGARLIYVLTNLGDYTGNPLEMVKVWQGGLSFHGGLLGGVVAGLLVIGKKKASFNQLADLTVPGLTIGYTLIRFANIFNQEVLGRPTPLSPFGRHPAQLYGAAIGLVLLLLHNLWARRNPPDGYLFWSFFLYYSILRGIIEETFRANPLFALGYTNEFWGLGFFTLTHLVTPALVLFAWWMRRQTSR